MVYFRQSLLLRSASFHIFHAPNITQGRRIIPAFSVHVGLANRCIDKMARKVSTKALFRETVDRSDTFTNKISAYGTDEEPDCQPFGKRSPNNGFSDTHACYTAAIADLNSLQSNAKTIEISRNLPPETGYARQRDTLEMLKVLNISMEQVDALNTIHVTGTKGKGSTCAFIEAILRARGHKTGLFTSPHLIEARERIRINGKPLSQADFTHHFRIVFDTLHRVYDSGQARFVQMPAYFQFLTTMAFHVFAHARIDVAIIEVGIGGEYDSTNVIQKPVVCAVSTIGYDHMPLLGKTLSQIAWNKAGIFKPGTVAVTASNQTGETMAMLTSRAAERHCKLFIVPELSEYRFVNDASLQLQSSTQNTNVSLALQCSNLWYKWCQNDKKHGGAFDYVAESNKVVTKLAAFSIDVGLTKTLNATRWAGRFQRLVYRKLPCFIDGAHTMESIKSCSAWYSAAVNACRSEKANLLRVLVFNSTSDREIETLLLPLIGKFDQVFFVPNQAVPVAQAKDNVSVLSPYAVQLARCHDHEKQWRRLMQISAEKHHAGYARVLGSVSDAFDEILKSADEKQICSSNVHVLVTGSLHLVGAFLSLADPTLGGLLEEDNAAT